MAAKRTVFATAGHVDHGKTSLIKALTGTDTDRLIDEKRRGISIELGFAELPESSISFIDVPGHRKLVHAMIAGVGGVAGALLVVAADDGVMPQTREHLHICSILGIAEIVVAISKCDTVDLETLELAELDVSELFETMGLRPRRIVRTAALDGEGLAQLREALEELANEDRERRKLGRTWMPVDRVFAIKGAGTVVTGTLTHGAFSVGQDVFVVGSEGELPAQCRELEMHGKRSESAMAPCRLAMNLARIDRAKIARGDVLTTESGLALSARFEASLKVIPGCEMDLSENRPVTVHIGTARRQGRVVPLAEGFVHITLDKPMPCLGGIAYVLRGFAPRRDHGAVVGGGRVLDALAAPLPRKREREAWLLRSDTLAAIQAEDWSAAVSGMMEMSAPRPLDLAQADRRLGFSPGRFASFLGGKKRRGPPDAVAVAGGKAFVRATTLNRLIDTLERQLARFHETHPHEPGMPLETARTFSAKICGRPLAELVVERGLKQKRLCQHESALCLPEFYEQAGPGARERAQRVLSLLEEEGLLGLVEAAIAARLSMAPELVRSALSSLARNEEVRRLSSLWFAETCLDDLRLRVRAYFAEKETMTVVQFKELVGVARKQAIPLLEQLDREGTTRRKDSVRVLGANQT